ncbi:hypothetical protein DL96DRAFT_1621537 [Flagelloscypha sp. PMI_526]|nr:hypothetical protein DL96DRAFT_1621537 [Flagelloscypha sp. PMI_526]
MTPTQSPIFFPPEILSKIAEIAADSGGANVALKLCCVSLLFHQSAASRLYHTLVIGYQDIGKLQMILRTSVPLRPWIASCVRVLIVYSGSSQELMNEALASFSCLRSLRVPIGIELELTCKLPLLRRIQNASAAASIPDHIAQNLTHLDYYGDISKFILLVAQRKQHFTQLSHLLLADPLSAHAAMEHLLDILEDILPNGLPDALKVFIISFRSMYYCTWRTSPNILEKLRNILKRDNRIAFWSEDAGIIHSDRDGPWFFYFQSKGTFIEQSLGALPDGAAGIWEQAGDWIQHRKGIQRV